VANGRLRCTDGAHLDRSIFVETKILKQREHVAAVTVATARIAAAAAAQSGTDRSIVFAKWHQLRANNTDAILQAYRLLGVVLRLANFEPNEIALGISGTAVVSSIAIPETVSLSSLQFQVSHNTIVYSTMGVTQHVPHVYHGF